jgi:ribosomal protein S18 acetylase RimI-like enzyme
VNCNLPSSSIPASIIPQQYGNENCQESLSKEPLQIAIRTAEIKDIDPLAEVLTQSFHPFKGVLLWLQPLLKLGIHQDLRSRLKTRSPDYVCLVAITDKGEDKEQIVGTIEINLRAPNFWLYSHKKSTYPYISNLAVSSSCRRRGVARQLLTRCDCIALGWGCQQLNLHVLDNNHRAQKLYYGSGYQLDRTESSWTSWLFKHPRRLLLRKKL